MIASTAKLDSPRGGGAWTALSWLVAICLFVPFYPHQYEEGLDAAWVMAMNQAVAQGLAFGREVIFTFGPYASLYTKAYHPGTHALTMASAAVLAACYAVALDGALRGMRWYARLAAIVVLLNGVLVRDVLFFSYPLLVAVCVIRLSVAPQSRRGTWLSALLFLPFGLLPLIKGSVLILCVALSVLTAAFALARRRASLAWVALGVPLAALPVFWMASGQALADLPAYFVTMAPIVSGYTDAMSLVGDGWEVALYVASALALLITLAVGGMPDRAARAYAWAAWALYLFLAFKGGFVRHDAHALIAGASLLFAAVLAAGWMPGPKSLPALALAVFTAGVFQVRYAGGLAMLPAQTVLAVQHMAQGVARRLSDGAWLEREHAAHLERLREKHPLPRLSGDLDVYSHGQGVLIASGNRWNPRPVLQSYSVYTPALAEANRAHLEGNRAPAQILFRPEPIDGRLAALEDGASWPVLLGGYEPMQALPDHLLLTRKQPAAATAVPVPRASGSAKFGQEIRVPDDPRPVWAELNVRPSALGKLLGLLYKPSELRVQLTMADGARKSYRYVAGMGASGFVLSPLVESAPDFLGLYAGAALASPARRVVSFSVHAVEHAAHWRRTVDYRLGSLPIAPTARALALLDIQAPLAPGLFALKPATRCDASLDAIDEAAPAPFRASGTVTVKGWLARSTRPPALAEQSFVVLRDAAGVAHLYPGKPVHRADVARHFAQPELARSGLYARLDLSGLDGPVSLGLAYREGQTVYLCPEWTIAGQIRKTP